MIIKLRKLLFIQNILQKFLRNIS